jgi:hypothetical protein
MASHGKVLDLFDDRYLNLQDVFGGVEPFPSLVPYEQYLHHMLVYRIDTNHEVYMALLQEFTDRFARTSRFDRKEAWTWCVQWEVGSRTADAPYTPTAKKQRLDAQTDSAKPAYTRIERRLLHPDLFQEEDMLRILIDIVQVESKLVPNYIEFLYQWVDYYEGGGRALKAALRMEIPSLWLFEFHPLPLFSRDSKDQEDDGVEKAAEEMGEIFTRRKAPLALEEMERLTEQSERLQYREVKFGMQRPIDKNGEPLPPLINVPCDDNKRKHYYAACFKNRQRAFWLLQEAGVTARQIANYKKLQPMGVKDTAEDINGDGWFNYYQEEPSAHAAFLDMKRMKELHEKQREIAISDRLAEEARIAATTNSGNGSPHLRPALISRTPGLPSALTSGRPDRVAEWLAKVKSMAKERDPPCNVVPPPMFGKTKSEVFKYAVALPPPLPPPRSEDPSDEDMDDDEHEEEYSNPDDIDPDERDDGSGDSMHGSPTGPTRAAPVLTQPTLPAQPGIAAFPNAPAYLRSLSPAQFAALMSLINPEARATIRNRYPNLFPQDQVSHEPTTGSGLQAGGYGLTNAASLGVGYQPSFPLNGPPGPPPISQFQQQFQMQPQPLNSTQTQAQLYLHQASPENSIRPSPSSVQVALDAAAQMNASSGHTGPALPVTYTPGIASSQPHPQQTGSLSGSRPVPLTVQEAILNAQIAQGSVAGIVSSFGAQNIQPGGAHHPGHGGGPAQNLAMPASSTVPAITLTQPQYGSPLQGNDVPRGVSPALHALLQSSRNITPIAMAAQGQNQPGQGQQGQPQVTVPLLSSQPVHDPSSGLFQRPDEDTVLSRSPAVTSFAQMMQASNRAPPPPNLSIQPNQPIFLAPRSPGLDPGSPSPMTPLAGLAGNLSLTTPQASSSQAQAGSFQVANPQEASPHGLPIQIYVPKVVVAHDSNLAGATDCLILGYTHPATGVLKLSKAIFFPTSIGENLRRRIQRHHAVVIEAYLPPQNHPRYAAGKGTLRNPDEVQGPHKFVHDKLTQVFALMTGCEDREREFTKRWRSTPGPMTARERGSVWEGWAVYVDRPVEMGYEERHGPGCVVRKSLDGRKGYGLSEEDWALRERRRLEVAQMIAEDEEDVSDEEDGGEQMGQ